MKPLANDPGHWEKMTMALIRILAAALLIGFATLLFGLVVLMPILGHASWHAYRELVE